MNLQKETPGAGNAEGNQNSSVGNGTIANSAENSSVPTFSEAFSVASQGCPVFPVDPKTGRPFSNLEVATLAGVAVPPEGEGGFKLASTDPVIVKIWADKWPDAQIGIPTGTMTNICCLDLDQKDGRDGFARCTRNGWAIPDAPTETSRSGKGAHVLFSMPEGGLSSVNNYGKEHKDDRTGIDRKADGGYLIWCGVDLTAQRPPVPEWFSKGRGSGEPADGIAPQAFIEMVGAWTSQQFERASREAPEHLKRECEKVADTGEGDRNGTLSASVFALRWAVLAGFLHSDNVRASLMEAAQQSGLPDAEALTTITKGLQSKKPVSLPVELRHSPEMLFGGAHPALPAGATALTVASTSPPPPPHLFQPEAISDAEWADTGALTPACIADNLYFADVGVRVAPGGVGKTTLALYEAMCLALGWPIFGCGVRRPGVTVFLTSEDQRGMLVQRLRRICEAANLTSEMVAKVRQNVRIQYVEHFKLTCMGGDTVVPSDGVRQVIEAFGPLRPSMIWIDPAVSFGVGESRVNDAEQGLITAARMIRNAIPDCAVMFIHHTGKANAREGTTDQYSGRGGSALADGARMVQVMKSLTREEWSDATGDGLGEDESAFVIARPKLSYVPPQGHLYVKRSGWSFSMFAGQSVSVNDEKARAVTLHLLRKRWERGEDVAKYRAHAALAKDAEADGIRKNKFEEAINSLIDGGNLQIIKNKRGSEIIVDGLA